MGRSCLPAARTARRGEVFALIVANHVDAIPPNPRGKCVAWFGEAQEVEAADRRTGLGSAPGVARRAFFGEAGRQGRGRETTNRKRFEWVTKRRVPPLAVQGGNALYCSVLHLGRSVPAMGKAGGWVPPFRWEVGVSGSGRAGEAEVGRACGAVAARRIGR